MIKISLRVKFLIVMATLLFTAITAYLVLAVTLFNNDKTTYIFEGNATLVNTIAAETTANFKNVQKTLNLITQDLEKSGTANRRSIEQLFLGEDELVEIEVFSLERYPSSPDVRIVRDDFFAPYKLTEAKLVDAQKSTRPAANNIRTGKALIFNNPIDKQIPLLGMASRYVAANGKTWIIASQLRQDRRVKLFSRSETFTTYLTDIYGNILAHPDNSKNIAKTSISGTPLFNDIVANKFETGVKAARVDKREIIFAFSKIPSLDLIVISEIDKSKAFLASQRLIEKSVLFAVLVLSLCLVVSVLFSKKITASLVKLYEATEEIVKGNFLIQVNVQSSDEVGALSSSFNRMAGEISRLMQETADKARMEKELETAQLVQDNFFPIKELELAQYGLASHYEPASECGGDWWGHMLLDNKMIILIGDATGHGVPSALITAAAQSCCSTLESIKRDNPNFVLSPGMILSKLNNAIYRASRGTVKMTFFCGILDQDTGRFTYANASHEMPLVCRANQEDLNAPRTKKDIVVCTGKTGFILGNEAHSEYDEHEIALLPGESIVMYTDGLVECKNSENQMYGKGRLLRNIFKNAQVSAQELRDILIKDAKDYFGERVRDDDVTLVVLKHKEPQSMARAI